jgi:serine/threonine-protein kinase
VQVPKESTVIAGRYRLEALIGEGGMASVWRARDLTLQRLVAVKLLFARDERDRQTLVDQFLREARIAAAVDHRNVIHIVDFGTADGNQPFMVMELLEGKTLGSRLQRGPPLTLQELLHVASLTLRGLAAVHDAGIIHRDLKPDNVFLKQEPDGSVFPKILDFGISRSVEPASGRRSALTTREGIIVGTPEYMSPEQARGIKSVDRRTDIYSMGAILYEALTGRLPFASENIGDLIIQIVTSTAPRVHELNPSIPVEVSDIVAKAMARSVDERYQDALEMQRDLVAATERHFGAQRRSLSDRPPPPSRPPTADGTISQDRLRTLEFPLDAGASPPIELAVAPHSNTPPRPMSSHPPSTPPRRSWSVPWVLVVAALAVVIAVVGRDVPSTTEPRSGETTAPPPDSEPKSALTRAIETVAPSAVPTPVIVRLRNVPQDATITVDGRPAPGDTLEFPRDRAERLIRVTAPARTPWQVVHASDRDTTYDVWLAQEPEPTASPDKRAAARKTRAARAPSNKSKAPSALRNLDF